MRLRYAKYIACIQNGSAVFTPEFEAMRYMIAKECPKYNNEQIAYGLDLGLTPNDVIQMIHDDEDHQLRILHPALVA